MPVRAVSGTNEDPSTIRGVDTRTEGNFPEVQLAMCIHTTHCTFLESKTGAVFPVLEIDTTVEKIETAPDDPMLFYRLGCYMVKLTRMEYAPFSLQPRTMPICARTWRWSTSPASRWDMHASCSTRSMSRLRKSNKNPEQVETCSGYINLV